MSSETSTIRTQTWENCPKRNTLHLEHGESLKTRSLFLLFTYYACGWVEFVILYTGEKFVVSRSRVDFSLNLGGESE